MILPSKHIKNGESILGLSTILYNHLIQPLTVDQLWIKFDRINGKSDFPCYHSFDNFIFALDLLFILKKISLAETKIIRNETN